MKIIILLIFELQESLDLLRSHSDLQLKISIVYLGQRHKVLLET